MMSSKKQMIYETAKRLFLEEGYNVGSRKIADIAGVNQGLITYYFKSKKNIAIAMLKEIYGTLSSYVRYHVSPQDDTFLYILTCTNISIRACKHDVKYLRLMHQLSNENVFEDSVRLGNNQTELYKKIIIDNMQPNGYSLEKNFDIVTGMVYGMVRNLFPRVNENNNYFTIEEFTELHIRTFIWALHLDWSEDQIQVFVQKINNISNDLWEKNPDIKNPMIFLFQNDKLK